MMDSENVKWERATRFASLATAMLGSFPAMLAAVAVILLWLASGPVFGFSDTWQLMINTFTTLVTFVMVFVIQNTTNREGRALQTKLDAIIEALDNTSDHLVGIEDLPEQAVKDEQEQVRSSATSPPESDPQDPKPSPAS